MTAPALRPASVAVSAAPATAGSLSERLDAERSGLRRRSIAAIAFAVITVAAAVATFGAMVLGDGRWMTLPRAVPFAFWTVAIVAAFAMARWVSRRDADAMSGSALADTIESEQGLRRGSLRGALEVGASGVLGQRAAADVARRLTPRVLAPQLAARLGKLLAIAAALALAAVAALSFTAAKSNDGFAAVVHPVRAFRGTLLPALGFDRLPSSVPRGMPITVQIRAEGRFSVVVARRAAGEAWSDTTITVNAATGLAGLALGPVRAPTTLRVTDGRAPAAQAVITVADRGWIGDVSLLAQFPSYLGRPSERLDPVPPLRVPRGTRVRVTATLRGGARNAMLTDGRDTVRFASDSSSRVPDGAPVSVTITLDRDSKWTWVAAATPRDGGETLPPELPDAMAFTVVPDRSPEVVIRSPRADTTVSTTGAVAIYVAAADDHGVRDVSLTVWRETDSLGVSKRERIDVANPGVPMFEGGATVALDGRDLKPGDRIHVVANAVDDSPWSQTSHSSAVILRVPGLSEQRSMARDLADSLAERARQLAAQERRLQQNTSDASRNRELKDGGRSDGAQSNGAKSEGAKSAMSFSAAEKSKQLAKEQQQLGAKIDSLRQSAKQLEDRLKSVGALDTALAARMRDVQKMLRDAMTPEMQKQLQQLEKSTERLSGTEAQQSLEQLAAQQQQMRDQLEKSAEMLKRAALEGAMGTLRDEAKDLATAQQQVADRGPKQARSGEANESKALADRARELERDVEALAKRLEQEGAKPGAQKTKAAQPLVNQAADAMQKAAQQQAREQQQQDGQAGEKGANKDAAKADADKNNDALSKALDALKDEKDKPAGGSGQKGEQGGAGQKPQSGAPPGQQQNGEKSAGEKSDGQQGQSGGSPGGSQAQKAASAMDKAAQQLAAAREAQVDAWKQDLSQQLDQSINETMQLARQQADLEQRAKQQGAQGMQGEQGAVQQGVQQAAERLEKAGRSSSLLSQRSQRAMSEAQRRVQQATQAAGSSQAGGSEQTQSAMKDATEALNQALSSLVRDRERVNNAESASGFKEMMDQLKQLAQQQGSLNGQMSGLNLLPGGAQGQQAMQQSRQLSRQQREVAKTLQDVSDADASGRTDALAKEAQGLAQQMERNGVDPSVAARQQQLYRRLLDAGRFLEQDERDDQGPREAKSGGADANRVDGPQSGRAGTKYAPPTWNELRGLGPEERRLVIEYFRRLNGNNP